MSADNWGVCPRCLAKAQAEKDALDQRVKSAYGNMNQEAWEELRTRAAKTVDEESLRTLREDYEIYIDEGGMFEVYYGAECGVCGLGHQFRHSEKVYP